MNLCVLLLLASPPMHGSLPATLVAPFRRCDRHFVTFQHQGRPTKTMTFSGFPKEQNLRTDLFSNQKVGDGLQLCHPIFILGVPFCKVTKSFHPYIKRVPHSAHVDATGTLPFCEGRNLDIALVGVWYTFESCSQHKHTHMDIAIKYKMRTIDEQQNQLDNAILLKIYMKPSATNLAWKN